jgi:hypothetical protein
MSTVANKLIKAKTDSGVTPDPDFTKLLTIAGASGRNGTTLLNDLDDATEIDYFLNSSFVPNSYGSAQHWAVVDDTNKVFFVVNHTGDRLSCADWSDDTNIVVADIEVDINYLDSARYIDVDPLKEYAYIYCQSIYANVKGISRYDYSDPTNLTALWNFNISPSLYGVQVNPTRELLYTFSQNTLYTYDISPTGSNSPILKDSLSFTTSFMWGSFLDTTNDILYAVSSNDKLFAFDVSSSTAAVLLDTLIDNTNLDYAVSVEVDVDAEIAFVSTRYGKISSIDVSDPSNLTLLDTYTGVGSSNSVTDQSMAIDAGAKRVYHSYGASFAPAGVKVIEYSDPSNLTLETTIDHASFAYRGTKVHLYN